MKKNYNIKDLSQLNSYTLIAHSQDTMFKKGISERVKMIGGFSYKGFEYVYHQGKNDKIYLFVTLYFEIVSAPYKLKGKKKTKREKYTLAVKFPYIQGMKKLEKLMDVPVELFSSDPSFLFFFAYALNKKNAVIKDHPKYTDWLGSALTKKPNKNNPNLRTELTKHFYKVLQFLRTQSPSKYLDERYLTSVSKITFPNKQQMKKLKK